MKPTVHEGRGMRVPLRVWDGAGSVTIERAALDQARNVCTLPFVHRHVALMPDAHLGKGSTIGSVIPTKDAIIPAAVGVDLGCGMTACRLPLSARELPDNLEGVRAEIERAVPHGRSDDGGASDRGAWSDVPEAIGKTWRDRLARDYDAICKSYPGARHRRPVAQLGTLGSGNHFIELCLDEDDRVWLMLHSGSRGPGNRIGSHFIALARKEIERRGVHLPDRDLAWLAEGADSFDDYVRAVGWAQDYARLNREAMMAQALRGVARALGREALRCDETAVDCHHNYVAREHHFGADVWVTRKGAVSARAGELGIIPGAMGRKSFIVRGKGNRESFHSCSHGAGRVMSRGEARRRFTVADHAAATAGLACRKDADVLDETPAAYKDVDAVLRAQTDLVDVVHTLRAVVCVKG